MSGSAPNLLHSAHSNHGGGVKSATAGGSSNVGEELGASLDLFTPSPGIVTEHQQVCPCSSKKSLWQHLNSCRCLRISGV